MRSTTANPELRLIELIAAQIQDDERLLDGLGDGVLSLQDVERWHRRRRAAHDRFLDECGRVIAEMRAQGFSRIMRRGGGHSPRHPRGMARWGGGPRRR